ncbi:MAG: ABC transporter ATP-binding protein [Hyphomicrobiales bacterium]|nr:ABC transporter ATP-binding protein [Hyphomicrobiales bacterium]
MIKFNNVSKYFTTPKGRKFVLQDVNLTIQLHEKIGVLGRNGAGKSSFLRLLAGVDIPDRGKITRTGSISWPMGLATGLQGMLTGRENAKFTCGIQGVGKRATDRKLKFIQDFSELGNYFEMPVRTYSSGMRARLNFALAMAFNFDFYIIDELTSVGDQAFRDKSRQVFERKRAKCGFIKVSHNLDELQNECDSGLLLHDGQLIYHPSIDDAISAYRALRQPEAQHRKGKAAAKMRAAKKAAAKKRAAKKRAAKQRPIAVENTNNAANAAPASTAQAALPGQQPMMANRKPLDTVQQPIIEPLSLSSPRPHKPAPMMPRVVRKAAPDG